MKNNMVYLFFEIINIFNKTECIWGFISGKGLAIRIKKSFISRTKRVHYSKNVVTLRTF